EPIPSQPSANELKLKLEGPPGDRFHRNLLCPEAKIRPKTTICLAPVFIAKMAPVGPPCRLTHVAPFRDQRRHPRLSPQTRTGAFAGASGWPVLANQGRRRLVDPQGVG